MKRLGSETNNSSLIKKKKREMEEKQALYEINCFFKILLESLTR